MKSKLTKNIAGLLSVKKTNSQIQSLDVQICEVFAGRAMVTDAGRANTCKRKFKTL